MTVPWFEREFDFSSGIEQYDALHKRLQHAPHLYRQTVAPFSGYMLHEKPAGKWSVKEHIGHLLLLEPLWLSRFGEIKAGKPVLSPADLNNTATHNAAFHEMPLQNLTDGFLNVRNQTLAFLDSLEADHHAHSSIHPRLQKPMRITDLMYFVAEHDTHHLNAIQSIIKNHLI